MWQFTRVLSKQSFIQNERKGAGRINLHVHKRLNSGKHGNQHQIPKHPSDKMSVKLLYRVYQWETKIFDNYYHDLINQAMKAEVLFSAAWSLKKHQFERQREKANFIQYFWSNGKKWICPYLDSSLKHLIYYTKLIHTHHKGNSMDYLRCWCKNWQWYTYKPTLSDQINSFPRIELHCARYITFLTSIAWHMI